MSLPKNSKRFEKALLETEIEHLSSGGEQLAGRKENLKPEHRGKHQINTVEPGARLMTKSNAPAYNGVIGLTTIILLGNLNQNPGFRKFLLKGLKLA